MLFFPLWLRWYGTPVEINADKKKHYYQNIFTGLDFSNYAIFDQILLKKVTFVKAPARFELITYRFASYTLTHCTTLLGNNIGK